MGNNCLGSTLSVVLNYEFIAFIAENVWCAKVHYWVFDNRCCSSPCWVRISTIHAYINYNLQSRVCNNILASTFKTVSFQVSMMGCLCCMIYHYFRTVIILDFLIPPKISENNIKV